MLKAGGTYGEGDEALEYYAKHTAQIEVCTSCFWQPFWMSFPQILLPERHHDGCVAWLHTSVLDENCSAVHEHFNPIYFVLS